MADILPVEYFQQTDTLKLARNLLGKVLVTELGDGISSGLITEVEAYLGADDKACHAFGYRRTARTETMYLPGGHAYVYLCYGIHHLFNIVTHQENEPHAILIRAIQPLEGIDLMLQRRNKTSLSKSLTAGPGSMSQALGIRVSHNARLLNSEIRIEDRFQKIPPRQIQSSPRIGVDYAGKDALLPYRFFLKDNEFVSGK